MSVIEVIDEELHFKYRSCSTMPDKGSDKGSGIVEQGHSQSWQDESGQCCTDTGKGS